MHRAKTQTTANSNRTELSPKEKRGQEHCWKNNKWQMYGGILGAWRIGNKRAENLQNAAAVSLPFCRFDFFLFCIFMAIWQMEFLCTMRALNI